MPAQNRKKTARKGIRRRIDHRPGRVWRPSANARACTSGPRASAVCTTWSGRSSTTRSTRRWPGTPPRSTSGSSSDGSVEVTDDGRGIPVAMHANGRPDRRRGDDPAARRRQVRRREQRLQRQRRPARRRRVGGQRAVHPARGRHPRDGHEWFAVLRPRRARHPQAGRAPPRRPAPPSGSGPTPDIFETTDYDFETVARRLQEMAFLNKGLTIDLADERVTPEEVVDEVVSDTAEAPKSAEEKAAEAKAPHKVKHRTFHYPGGLVDYVKHINRTKTPDPAEHHRLRRQGRRPRGRDRDAVERRLFGVGAHLRQHHQHPRGRHPRRGVPGRVDDAWSTSTPRTRSCSRTKTPT